MSMKNSDFAQLIRYTDGELNDNEKRVIIERLKSDKSLNEIMVLIEDVKNVLSDKGLITFNKCLKNAEKVFLTTWKNNKVKGENYDKSFEPF